MAFLYTIRQRSGPDRGGLGRLRFRVRAVILSKTLLNCADVGFARDPRVLAACRSQILGLCVYMPVGFEAGGDDAALLAAAGSDPEAFARFYDRYERAVTGFFVRRTSTPEAAADLTAEVFTAALGAAGRYRPDGPTAAVWLFTIARNTLRSSVRRGRVEAGARRRAGMMPVALEDDSLARLTRVDGDRWVREMLDRLPDQQRDAIRARVLQEREYGEIAHQLKTSEMVIRKRVSRGLATLREHMERPQ